MNMKRINRIVSSWLYMTTITLPSAVRLTIRTSLHSTEGQCNDALLLLLVQLKMLSVNAVVLSLHRCNGPTKFIMSVHGRVI